jgi:hypothetical protein
LEEKIEKPTENINGFQIVGTDQMEQRSVVHFLRLKGFSKTAIHHELVAVLQANAVSYSSVTRFDRETKLVLNSKEVSSSPKDDGLDEVNKTILLTLSDEPFLLSGRHPAGYAFQKALYIVGLSILCISQSGIRHRHSVPHKHSDSQKTSRVELSIQPRDLLLSIRHQGSDGDID